MLTDKLRDGAHGKTFKVLFILIMLSFVFAGVGNYLIPRLNSDPVQVGEIKVKAEDWNGAYQDQVRSMQNQYGSQVNALFEKPEYVKALRMQVLDRIVDNVSLSTATYDAGIRIGDDQVKAAIRNEKAFYKDDKFNNELFLATVRNMGSSPDYFAQQMRTQISQETIAEPVINSGASVYPYEVEMLAKLFAQQRVVDLYSVNVDALKDSIKTTEDDAKKFYDAHHNVFMKPATSNFSYIVLSVNDLKKSVKVTDDKLEEYFNLNQTDFAIPQKREASQIIIKATTPDFAKKAADALAALKLGTSFEDVGAKFSDDADFSQSHGSLGNLEQGSLSEALDIALFKLAKVGDYSEVVVDESGAHILRLDGFTESMLPKFADVKEEVTKKYIDAQALELFTQKSSTLTDVSYENPDSLDAAANATGAQILQSGDLALGDKSAKWPLNTDEVQKVAFNEDTRTSHQNSLVISLGNEACAVINVAEYKDAVLQKFDDVKDRASELAAFDMLKDKSNEILADIKAKVSKGSSIDENALVKLNKDVLISRGDQNYEPMFGYDVFSIANKANEGAITSNKGVPTLAILKEVKTDSEANIDHYAQFIRSQLVQFKVEKANSMLHSGARELSEIKYNEDAINQVIQQNNTVE